MATVIKTCRVCGKKYEACATARRADGVFRWQEVACSPDCGEEYLAAVLRGRSAVIAPAAVEYPAIDDDEDIENELEDEFDDEDFLL